MCHDTDCYVKSAPVPAASCQRTPCNQSNHSGPCQPHPKYPEEIFCMLRPKEIQETGTLTSISSWVTGSPMNFIISPSSRLSM